jgi:hypothetical protein
MVASDHGSYFDPQTRTLNLFKEAQTRLRRTWDKRLLQWSEFIVETTPARIIALKK